MKHTKKIGIKVFVGISILSGGATRLLLQKKSDPVVVEVSNDARNNLAKIGKIETRKHKNNTSYEDKNITDKLLSNVEEFELDMRANKNISFLKYFNKLNSLKIYSSQRLTKQNIKDINENSVKDINLYFDVDDIYPYFSEGFDLNRFKSKNIKVFFENFKPDEVNKVMLLTYLKNYKTSFLEKSLNNIFKNEYGDFEKIIDLIDIKEADSEKIKLLKIITYITNHIKYDQMVSNHINEYGSIRKESSVYKKVYNYNVNSISSVLRDGINNETDGICINYSDLFTTLAHYIGLEVYTMKGQLSFENVKHAWNIVKVDGKLKYVDLTNLDKDYYYNYYLSEYRKNNDYMFTDDFYEYVFSDVDEIYYENYNEECDVNDMTTKKQSNVIMYNTNIKGQRIENNYNPIIPYIVGLGNGLTVFGIYDYCEKKQRVRKK